jgi:hypothetical protein
LSSVWFHVNNYCKSFMKKNDWPMQATDPGFRILRSKAKLCGRKHEQLFKQMKTSACNTLLWENVSL